MREILLISSKERVEVIEMCKVAKVFCSQAYNFFYFRKEFLSCFVISKGTVIIN